MQSQGGVGTAQLQSLEKVPWSPSTQCLSLASLSTGQARNEPGSRAPSPPGGAPAGPPSRRKRRGRHAAGQEAMDARVGALLLAQLLVFGRQGELRRGLPAVLGLAGGGGGACRAGGAHRAARPPRRVSGWGPAVCR